MLKRVFPNLLPHLLLPVGYLLLDWASYIHPLHGLSITPWNPAPALGVFFLVRFGWRAAPGLWLAIFLADVWVRQLPVSLSGVVVLAGALMMGYWGIAELLRWRLGSCQFRDLAGMRDWGLAIVIGTLANSAVFVSLLTLTQLVPAGGWYEALYRSWIGDSVGLLVALPAFWLLFDPAGRAQLAGVLRARGTAAYLLVVPLCLWVAFGLGAESNFKYFYALFLPLALAAAVQGLAGAMVCAAVLQVGVLASVVWLQYPAITVFEVQVLSVALALFGFVLGVLVDERERLNQELRHTLRLAAAGEMASALAHELNQPMTALSAYGTVCESLLARNADSAELNTVVARMVEASARAAEVVRRLRDFFRTGATRLERLSVAELLAPVIKRFREQATIAGVDFTARIEGDAMLFVDRLQLEVVLRNLLANAFEAVGQNVVDARRVSLAACVLSASRLRVTIQDNGPGLPAQARDSLFEAFRSTKSQGMGLGLVISRAIVDSHGGQLWAEERDGTVFCIELPLATDECQGESNDS